MFKKYYKAANDDIKTNRELIDKIFETAEKPSKTVKFAKVYKIGTAVAAVVVLAIGAISYPQLVKLNETPNLPTETVVRPVKENASEPVNEGASEPTPQPKTTEPTIQPDTSVPEVTKTAPEPIADAENSVMTDVPDDEFQPYLIPESTYARTIDAQAAVDANEILFDSFKVVSAEEIEKVQSFLILHFGEKDETTGNAFIFEIVGKAEGMYLGRWKWWVVDHSSKLCEFVLNEELTEMYDCTFNENNAVVWNASNNLLNN